MSKPIPLNFIGNINSRSGLGLHIRHMIRSSLEHGYAVRTFDTEWHKGRSEPRSEIDQLAAAAPTDLPVGINLYLLQPASIFEVSARYHSHLFQPGMINVAQPMWELPILPPRWRRALTGFDALLCGSRYLEAVYQLQVPGALTLPSPCPISLPERIQRRRADYGLPEGITLFMTAFDPASDLARKNPLGSVDAYLLAFPKEEGKTMLLLKANGLDKRPEGAMLANHIRDRVGSRQDIRLLDASMSYEDTLGLYACADAFVSLHRSEGLGLPLLEAMMLGLPVIATAWSGNMSFMSPGSACLVDYDFIRVQAYLDVYQQAYLGAPAYWADPSLESACAWMRRLDESPELRLQIGQSAKKQARQYVEQALKADYLEQIQALADSHWTTGRARPQIAPHDLWQAARQREPGPLQTALDALSREFSRYVWRWQQ